MRRWIPSRRRIAARLADDPYNAAAILRKQAGAAELAVAPCLKHAEPQVQLLAAKLLAEIGTAKSLPPLREAAGSRNRSLALAARAAWQKIDPATLDAIEIAALDLQGDNPLYRRAAIEHLAAVHPDTRLVRIAPLIEEIILSKEQHLLHASAARALVVWAADTTVAHLLPALRADADAATRRTAIAVLVGLRDLRVVPALMGLSSTDFRAATDALATMGGDAEDAVDKLLADADRATRQAAARVLAVIGTERSIPALTAAAKQPQDSAAAAAKQALDAVRNRGKRSRGGP